MDKESWRIIEDWYALLMDEWEGTYMEEHLKQEYEYIKSNNTRIECEK